MKLAVFLIVLLSSTLLATAQSDFKPGYIITHEEDTVYGTIDLRANYTMHKKCVFIAEGNDSAISYSPEEIIAYRFIDGKYYASKEIYEQMIFLEFILSGEINLYMTSADGNESYYIEKEEDVIIELPYSTEIREKDDRTYEYHSTKHIGIIKYYMSDAPEMNSKIDELKSPDKRALINLTKDYHDIICDGDKCIIYEKPRSPFKADLNIAFGVGVMKNRTDKDLKFNATVYGFTSDIFLTRTSEKLFIRVGVMHYRTFESDKGEKHYFYDNIMDRQTSYEVPDSETYFPIQIGYKFPQDYRIRPAISISLLSPEITPSVDFRIVNKLSLGIQAWLMYYTKGYYNRNSVLLSLSYTLD